VLHPCCTRVCSGCQASGAKTRAKILVEGCVSLRKVRRRRGPRGRRRGPGRCRARLGRRSACSRRRRRWTAEGSVAVLPALGWDPANADTIPASVAAEGIHAADALHAGRGGERRGVAARDERAARGAERVAASADGALQAVRYAQNLANADAIPGGLATEGIHGADARHDRAAPIDERLTGRTFAVGRGSTQRAMRNALDLASADAVPSAGTTEGIRGADARHDRTAPVDERCAGRAFAVATAVTPRAQRDGLDLANAGAVPSAGTTEGILGADARHDRAAPADERCAARAFAVGTRAGQCTAPAHAAPAVAGDGAVNRRADVVHAGCAVSWLFVGSPLLI